MNKFYIFCHSYQKVKTKHYKDSYHIEWNISSLYFVEVWWLWLTDNETQNSVSQKIWILHKMNKKWYFKQKCLYLVWPPFAWLLHQCSVTRRPSACGPAQVWWKPRLLRQRPSGHLHCWLWCRSSSSWQWIYIMFGFHFLKWVTKNIELFHDILIFLDLPIKYFTVMFSCFQQINILP